MQTFKGTFEELEMKLESEVKAADNPQVLYRVGEGLLIRNDNLFGYGGLGWILWFDRSKWDTSASGKPRARPGCGGTNWGFVEGTDEEIIRDMLDEVEYEKLIKPVNLSRPWQAKRHAQITYQFELIAKSQG